MDRRQQLKKLTQYPEWEVYKLAVSEDMVDLMDEFETMMDKTPEKALGRSGWRVSFLRRGMRRALDIALDYK